MFSLSLCFLLGVSGLWQDQMKATICCSANNNTSISLDSQHNLQHNRRSWRQRLQEVTFFLWWTFQSWYIIGLFALRQIWLYSHNDFSDFALCLQYSLYTLFSFKKPVNRHKIVSLKGEFVQTVCPVSQRIIFPVFSSLSRREQFTSSCSTLSLQELQFLSFHPETPEI